MTVTILPSGYVHIHLNADQYVQWPAWRSPADDDVFHGPLSRETWKQIHAAFKTWKQTDDSFQAVSYRRVREWPR